MYYTHTTIPKKEYIFLYPNLFGNQPKLLYELLHGCKVFPQENF